MPGNPGGGVGKLAGKPPGGGKGSPPGKGGMPAGKGGGGPPGPPAPPGAPFGPGLGPGPPGIGKGGWKWGMPLPPGAVDSVSAGSSSRVIEVEVERASYGTGRRRRETYEAIRREHLEAEFQMVEGASVQDDLITRSVYTFLLL